MFRSAFSASLLIVAGTFGSFVASAICTLTSPFSMETDFTRPNEIMSRVKPGYFTDFKAFFTCSSEIDISEPYACRARGKPCARAQRVKGGPASPENASPARTDGRGNAEGANIRRRGRNFLADALSTTRSTEWQSSLSVLVIHFVANLI